MKHFLLSLLFLLPLCAHAQEGVFVVDHLARTIDAFMYMLDNRMICDDLEYRPVGENEVEVAGINYLPEERVHETVNKFFYYQKVLQFGLDASYQYYWDLKSELESLDESQEDYEEAREKIEAQLLEFEPFVEQIEDWQHRYTEELDMVAQDLDYRSPAGLELFDFIIHLLDMSDMYRGELAQIYDGMPEFPESDIMEELDYFPFSFFIDDLAHEHLEIEQQITEIIIPESICDGKYVVTSIGYRAFAWCSSLTSVVIPESVTSIGNDAFYGCLGLTSVTIPASVVSIGNYAFQFCSSLTSVTIPASVVSIGRGAYDNCSGLTSVTIPASVTSLGRRVFGGCKGLETIDVESDNPMYSSCDGVLFDKAQTTLIEYPGGKHGPYIIPASVASIGSSAFSYCSSLTSLTIPASVTSIGDNAFSECSSLTFVTIPESVASIGSEAFEGCTALPVENGLRYADSYLVRAVDRALSAYSIKEGTRFIAGKAFYQCKALTSVTIPASVTSIGDDAFYGCSGLTSVTIPASVTSIGHSAFCYCSGLTSVTIPASVVSIGSSAFDLCSSLTDVCSLNPTPQKLSFYSAPTTCTLHVPAGAKEAYAAANGWKQFTNIVEDAEVYAVKSELQGKIDNLAAEKEALEQKVADLEALVEALQNKMAGDVDGDGQITAGDITKVIQNALQLTK